MAELTPMMQQYYAVKERNPDCLLFFRLGDFYEMFEEDARIASRELDLTLTSRDHAKDKSAEDKIPMCGVPYHSSESYIARLVAKGYKVAICEQMEDPALAKGLVKRDIIRIVTPGSVTESSMLVESKNNYYACVYGAAGTYGLCFCDVSTGAFSATQISGADAMQDVQNELGSFLPSEALLGGTAALFRTSAARFAALFAHALPVDVHDKQQHRKDNDKHQNKFQNAENHRAALRAARFGGCTAFGRGRFRTAGGGLFVACSAHSRRVCGVAGFIRFRCRCHGVKEL